MSVAKDWVVGADVGGTQVKYVVCAASHERRLQGEIRTDRQDPVRTLQALVREISSRLPATTTRLGAVGLACAGIVSARAGSLGRSPNLPGWQGAALAELTRTAFGGLPAVIANDVNAALYGEWRLGAGLERRARSGDSLVMIALGTGVGGGVIVAGKLLTGAADGAGEIGHMVLDLEGPPCSCGNRGCLEAYAGEVALVRRARERVADEAGATSGLRALVDREGERLNTKALFESAAAGDTGAAALFEEAGRRLGQAVANVVNLLDPDRIIIGGGVAQAGELLLAPCRRMVSQLVLSAGGRDVPIVPAQLGPFAAALGAAVLAREQAANL
jgi:glucokinase